VADGLRFFPCCFVLLVPTLSPNLFCSTSFYFPLPLLVFLLLASSTELLLYSFCRVLDVELLTVLFQFSAQFIGTFWANGMLFVSPNLWRHWIFVGRLFSDWSRTRIRMLFFLLTSLKAFPKLWRHFLSVGKVFVDWSSTRIGILFFLLTLLKAFLSCDVTCFPWE